MTDTPSGLILLLTSILLLLTGCISTTLAEQRPINCDLPHVDERLAE